jgi:hypothetical protein
MAKEQPDKPKAGGRYRKVEVRTWGDAKFRALSPIPPCGQGLWLFLITGPHTGPIPGLFRAGRAAMAEELGWEVEAFDQAFREAFRQGMVEADFRARVMWIPRAISHNKPESPNVVRSWSSEFDLIPECDLKWRAFEALKASIHALGEPYGKAFDETFPKPSAKASIKTSPNQEQEQEQEQEYSEPIGSGVVTPLPLTSTAELQLVGEKFPAHDHQPDAIWDIGLEYLVSKGTIARTARGILGQLRKSLGNDLEVAELLAKAQELDVSEPVAWLRAAAARRLNGGRSSSGVAL